MNFKQCMPFAMALTLVSSFIFTPLNAEEDPAIAAINKSFAGLFNGDKPDAIEKSDIPGVYTITMGTEVIYASADGRYLIYGDVIDSVKRVNLTEMAKEKADQVFSVKRKVLMDKQD